ncbi:hypothetical protein SR870_07470 [Rhodopseudomonas palustris]|uniref:hypothetical protein n=1 Tax=Rhodopseudomonas palustris TaxID=1076 RepID=UPI002ACE4EBA|nr:hypothetical protein [Rhodopseudomonas palustris]WQH01102.1 hypothetical protein SR870_07470 [Rhodopseudomonas palustris]
MIGIGSSGPLGLQNGESACAAPLQMTVVWHAAQGEKTAIRAVATAMFRWVKGWWLLLPQSARVV